MGDKTGKGGYKDPPEHTRFSSTNQPTARRTRKGSLGVKSELKKLLSKEVTFKVDGVPKKGMPIELVLRTFFAQAAAGRGKAGPAFLDLAIRLLGADDLGTTAPTLSAADNDTLVNYMRDYLAEQDASPVEPAAARKKDD